MKKVVLFGHGAVARMAHFLLTNDSQHDIVASTVDRASMREDRMFGLPTVAFEDAPSRYPPSEFAMFIAVGYSRINGVRERKYLQAKELGYELISYVSTKATTWPDLAIGDNCFIMEDVIIQPFVKIGNDVILWSGCHIGHESVIGDHCFVSSHAVVSGLVTVDAGCFLGSNSTIRDGIRLARQTVVGAGAVVMTSTQERGVYVAPRAHLLPITSDRLPNL